MNTRLNLAIMKLENQRRTGIAPVISEKTKRIVNDHIIHHDRNHDIEHGLYYTDRFKKETEGAA